MAPANVLRSSNRKALLGVYAALDTEGKLEGALRQLGVTFDGPPDAYAQLRKAAEPPDKNVPRIHRIHLALAAMDVLHGAAAPKDGARKALGPVVEQLVKEGSEDGAVDAVHAALERAASKPATERWAQVHEEVYDHLLPEICDIEDISVQPELRSVAGEAVSRIETHFIVKCGRTLQEIAPALLPENWKHCNDFFCDLIRKPDRDVGLGPTGGSLSTAATHWRGVYEERVGACPDGWYPDTFLLFTWDHSLDSQLILSYELAPPRRNDRTVLKIDEGYIQVNQLPGAYEVTTLKYLLFDDQFMPDGGQILGGSLLATGWLDAAINQFTSCADNLPDGGHEGVFGGGSIAAPRANTDAGLQRVLDRCAANLRESATSADAQVNKVVSKVRNGQYGLNDFIGDWGDAALRAMRDASRAFENQIDYAKESLDIAGGLASRKDTRS